MADDDDEDVGVVKKERVVVVMVSPFIQGAAEDGATPYSQPKYPFWAITAVD